MTGPQLKYALDLSRRIKSAYPDKPIVWGGVHPTFFPDQILEGGHADVIVRGEGEVTFLELINELNTASPNLDNIDGISYKEQQKIIHNKEKAFITNLDQISIPWDLIDLENYVTRKEPGRLVMITSRGCSHRCAFCYNVSFNKCTWRGWSSNKTKKELKKLIQRGVGEFNFYDDDFVSNPERLQDIMKFLSKHNIGWRAGIRAGYLSSSLVKKLSDAGCREIFIGAESGSQRILNMINKDMNIESVVTSAELLLETSIQASYSWIIGFPTETHGEIMLTLHHIDRIRKINPNSIHFIKIYTPYPGGELYDLAVEQGFLPPESILEWSVFTRENCKLGYIKDKWLLKSISYTSYFAFHAGRSLGVKYLYRIPFFVLGLTSRFRWSRRFFRIPVEYMLLELLKPNISGELGGD